ncbi:uncharacterized protein SPPG_08769 [Spizellomyces punctatus DAOM BR117]|uniref:PPM-type phosphatase domain-containing protein n=1 Tax=Spizellomyces punctatus (strain DAOM BR117) TaxID=645134 RepID=A0A0L0H2Z8_SPIPD|nr:uncharacterized protein SPPG_08769 [Spizellomyces punctatus DAOM BR117]KNC95830.1 hypothetical protein SPPG_08769 [Spizellomyces punctatus DAOM BR117]|eukprot:XP_016603870.1 hypothetical protein SPPG_08769 [Spizellomyces punctatus DAOM BR117]
MTTDEQPAVQNEESLVSSCLSMKQLQAPHAAPCSRPRTFFASIPGPSQVIQLPRGHRTLSLNEDGYKTFTIELPVKENDTRQSTSATCVALMDAHGPGFVPPLSKKALETWRGSPGQQFLALLGNVLVTVLGRIIRSLISECGSDTYALELTRRLDTLHQELDNELQVRDAVLAENCGASLALAILIDGDIWLCNIGDCSMMLFNKSNGEPLKVWSNEGDTSAPTSCPDTLNLSTEREGLIERDHERMQHCIRRACGPNGIARYIVCSPHSAYAIFKTNCVGSFGHKHQLLKRTSVYKFCIREICEKTSDGSVIVGLVSDGVTSLMTPSVIGSTLVSIEKTCSILGGVENLLNGPMDGRPSGLATGNVRDRAAELLHGAIQHQKTRSTSGHHVPLKLASEAVTSLASLLGAEKDASVMFFDLGETQEERKQFAAKLEEAETTPQEAPQEAQVIPRQLRAEEHVITPGTLLFSPEMPLLSSVIMLPEISTARQTGHAFASESRDQLRIDFCDTAKLAFSESDMLDSVRTILQTRYHDGKKRRRESDNENPGTTGHMNFSPTIQELLQRARDIRAEMQDSAPTLQPEFETDGVSGSSPAIEGDIADTISKPSVEVSSYESPSPRKRRKTGMHDHCTVDAEATPSRPDPTSNSAASQPSERAALRNEGEDGQELVSSPTTDGLAMPIRNDTVDNSNQYAQDHCDGKMVSDDFQLEVKGIAAAKQEVHKEGQDDTGMRDRMEPVADSDEAMDVDVPLEDKCETLPVISEGAMHDVSSVPYEAELDSNVTDVDYVSQIEHETDTTCQQRSESCPSTNVVVPSLGCIMEENPAKRVASGAEPSSVMPQPGFEAMHDIPLDGAHRAGVVENSSQSQAHSAVMMDADGPCERDTILPARACNVEIEALPRTDLTTTSTNPENNSTGPSICDTELAGDDGLTRRQEDIKCVTEPYQSDSEKAPEGSPEGDHNDVMDIADGTVSDSSAPIKISHDDTRSNQKECGIIHVTIEGASLKVEMEDEESGAEENMGTRERISFKHGEDTECHSDIDASSNRVSDYADSQTTCAGSVASPIIGDDIPNTVVAEEQMVEYEGLGTPEVAELTSSPTELPNVAVDEEGIGHEEQDSPEAEDVDAGVNMSKEMEPRVFTFHEPSMLLTKTYNCGFSFAEGSRQLVSQEAVVDRQEEITVQLTNPDGNREIHGLGIADCQDQLVHEEAMHTSRSVESDGTAATNKSAHSIENSQGNRLHVDREQLSGHGQNADLSVALSESISLGPRLRTQGEESDDEDKKMREDAVDSVPLDHLDNPDDGLEGDVSAPPNLEGDKDDCMDEEEADQQPAASDEMEGEQWC